MLRARAGTACRVAEATRIDMPCYTFGFVAPDPIETLMATGNFSADTYIAAREKFLSAARAARCDLSIYPLPNHMGPDGQELTIDVGKLGPPEPEAILVLISGTHGVEGFCGSGCQLGFLADRLYEALPVNCGALLVHALNPYGFAWLRRVNEKNVDLNRNFHDFSKDLPSCSAYEELHDWLVPLEWEGEQSRCLDQTNRAASSSVGSRPSGVNLSTTFGKCWLSPFSMSSRDIPE